ncbi:hypothetical protein [Nocardia sp. NPDC049149]|uniref:hypothetical protein n=1 Tax=Nocardia sp. NPDC049149 TaxID=3364315 RepID=UPI00371398A5
MGELRLVRPLVGTVAALALVIGGLTAFSNTSEPGSPQWRVELLPACTGQCPANWK